MLCLGTFPYKLEFFLLIFLFENSHQIIENKSTCSYVRTFRQISKSSCKFEGMFMSFFPQKKE